MRTKNTRALLIGVIAGFAAGVAGAFIVVAAANETSSGANPRAPANVAAASLALADVEALSDVLDRVDDALSRLAAPRAALTIPPSAAGGMPGAAPQALAAPQAQAAPQALAAPQAQAIERLVTAVDRLYTALMPPGQLATDASTGAMRAPGTSPAFTAQLLRAALAPRDFRVRRLLEVLEDGGSAEMLSSYMSELEEPLSNGSYEAYAALTRVVMEGPEPAGTEALDELLNDQEAYPPLRDLVARLQTAKTLSMQAAILEAIAGSGGVSAAEALIAFQPRSTDEQDAYVEALEYIELSEGAPASVRTALNSRRRAYGIEVKDE